MSIIKTIPEYEPTEIVKISVEQLTVPIEVATELSKLALVEKQILIELLKDSKRDKQSKRVVMHPETLFWAKEFRMILKEINDMTKGVQEKAMLKKMDIVGDLYKEIVKKAEDKDLVNLIKKLDRNESEERPIVIT